MQKHFFTFRKTINGFPEPVYIEIVIAENISRKDARPKAMREVEQIRQAFRAWKVVEPQAATLPDFTFVGAN